MFSTKSPCTFLKSPPANLILSASFAIRLNAFLFFKATLITSSGITSLFLNGLVIPDLIGPLFLSAIVRYTKSILSSCDILFVGSNSKALSEVLLYVLSNVFKLPTTV